MATRETLEDDLRARYPLQSLILTPRGDDAVRIDTIRIQADERGRGHGEAVMREIVHWADSTATTLVLTPEADYGSRSPAATKKRLAKWYASFGFVPNKGRRKDFRFTDAMIRYPLADNQREAILVRKLLR